MKRFILVVCLLLITFGASAQGWRNKRKVKQAQEENLPVMAIYKAANNEKFILYFGGKKINEEPATEVAVKGVNLNEPYNVRVVLKSPYVVANMNFRLTTLTKEEELFVVYRNAHEGKVEIFTSEEYHSKFDKNRQILSRINSDGSIDSFTVVKPIVDTMQSEQIKVISIEEMLIDTLDEK